jgi:hypothetical protein
VSKRHKSTGGQKSWLDARLLAHLEHVGKHATRFDRPKLSLGVLADAILPPSGSHGTTRSTEDDPYNLCRLDEQRRVLLIEGAARRLERDGLVIFHPHSKKVERAKSLLEVLAYVSRTDQEIHEEGRTRAG